MESLQASKKIFTTIGILFIAYIVTMPFSSAFALTPVITFPVLFGSILFLFMIFRIIFSIIRHDSFWKFDTYIILILVIEILFSFFVNGLGNRKSFNHTIAYFVTFCLFYLTIKYIFIFYVDKNSFYSFILPLLSGVTFFCALFSCAEFLLYNFFSFDPNQYVPRVNEDAAYYDAMALGSFYRARGFASESGHYTFMMELFSPITVYYLFFSKKCHFSLFFKFMTCILIFFSFLFTVSAASFIIVPLSILVTSVIKYKTVFLMLKKEKYRFLMVLIFFSLIFFLLERFYSIFSLIQLSIVGKIEFGAYDYRNDLNLFFFYQFPKLSLVNQLIGVGPSGVQLLGYGQGYSILCLYYSIIFEIGILGFTLLFLFLFYVFWNLLKIRSSISFFLMISIFSGLMHYYFIANYYYPWFWFIAAIIIFYKKELE
jgi:hypothetical protein